MSAPVDSPTISQIVRAFYDDVSRWAREHAGTAILARDPEEPYDLIGRMAAADFLIVVSWGGDKEVGGNVLQHIDRHTIQIWLARARGLTSEPNRDQVTSTGNRPALLDLVESCKQSILELRFPRELTRKHTAYVGADPVATPDGLVMAAYKLTFTLDVAGRNITYRDVTFNQ